MLVLVLAALAYAAAFDLDSSAEWIVFAMIIVTVVGAMIAVHKPSSGPDPRSRSRLGEQDDEDDDDQQRANTDVHPSSSLRVDSLTEGWVTRRRSTAETGATGGHGHYWARTSDLRLVEAALSQLS